MFERGMSPRRVTQADAHPAKQAATPTRANVPNVACSLATSQNAAAGSRNEIVPVARLPSAARLPVRAWLKFMSV